VHRTSDLLAMLEAWVELDEVESACDLASLILDRQVPEDKAQQDIFGHFYTFEPEHELTERAWSHCIVQQNGNREYGSDIGQAIPHWVTPVIKLLSRHPDHADAPRWQASLSQYLNGFLLPACKLNPFGIMPLGYVAGEGWLHFAGPWHGHNSTYGWTACLAMEMAQVFPDDTEQLEALARNNLQWIAGLNAGLTREAAEACVFLTFSNEELPPGRAMPISMVQGFGQRNVGGWTTLRGNVANGFAVGEQFKFDIPATLDQDGPFAYTDEDWIPHAAAYLAGACRLPS
jgi:hypothetical protein